MNAATRIYLEYVQRNGTALGVELVLGRRMMEVELPIIADDGGAEIPAWYGNMLDNGKRADPIIYDEKGNPI